MRQGIGILGIQFDTASLAQAKETVIRLAKRQKGALVATPNGTIVANAQKHPELFDALRDAALVLPDGVSVVRAAKALGTPFPFVKNRLISPVIKRMTNIPRKLRNTVFHGSLPMSIKAKQASSNNKYDKMWSAMKIHTISKITEMILILGSRRCKSELPGKN